MICLVRCQKQQRKASALVASAQVLSPVRFKDISLRSWLVHSTTVLENTEAQRTAILVTWIAGILDSLVIKACAVRVLMLFLTSKVPLPVILSKAIIQNVVRSLFDKSPEHQVFLLFAALWATNQFSLTTPGMSNFYQVRLFSSSGSLFQSCCSLKK